MIPRYSNPEMVALWTEETKCSIWLEIEGLALEGMVAEGLAPREALDAYRERAKFSLERVQEIEAKVKHDVIAFLTNVAEYVGPLSRYVHRGMTSSDVLDTSLAVQLKRASELIEQRLTAVLATIEKRAVEFKFTPCIGRSHGIHAEPVTFGLKLIGWFAELKRHQERISRAKASISVGKLAGAVGTYAGISPSIEQLVMNRLGLVPETVATQVVARDRHAEFVCALAQLAGSIERFATEVRHLQRSEVGEVCEGFTPGQKGSSAMPHKRNPILTENLCGIARLVRSYSLAALENVPLWHERDISHSSVERVMLPDACIAIDFMLTRLDEVVRNLVVFPERMRENMELTRGTIFSGHLLLLLVDRGMSREDAYALVQRHAFAACEGGPNLRERVLQDGAIMSLLSDDEVEAVFSTDRHLKQVETIFDRALRQ